MVVKIYHYLCERVEEKIAATLCSDRYYFMLRVLHINGMSKAYIKSFMPQARFFIFGFLYVGKISMGLRWAFVINAQCCPAPCCTHQASKPAALMDEAIPQYNGS